MGTRHVWNTQSTPTHNTNKCLRIFINSKVEKNEGNHRTSTPQWHTCTHIQHLQMHMSTHTFLKILNLNVFCLHVCMSNTWMQYPQGSGGHQMPWNWNYRQLWRPRGWEANHCPTRSGENSVSPANIFVIKPETKQKPEPWYSHITVLPHPNRTEQTTGGLN